MKQTSNDFEAWKDKGRKTIWKWYWKKRCKLYSQTWYTWSVRQKLKKQENPTI